MTTIELLLGGAQSDDTVAITQAVADAALSEPDHVFHTVVQIALNNLRANRTEVEAVVAKANRVAITDGQARNTAVNQLNAAANLTEDEIDDGARIRQQYPLATTRTSVVVNNALLLGNWIEATLDTSRAARRRLARQQCDWRGRIRSPFKEALERQPYLEKHLAAFRHDGLPAWAKAKRVPLTLVGLMLCIVMLVAWPGQRKAEAANSVEAVTPVVTPDWGITLKAALVEQGVEAKLQGAILVLLPQRSQNVTLGVLSSISKLPLRDVSARDFGQPILDIGWWDGTDIANLKIAIPDKARLCVAYVAAQAEGEAFLIRDLSTDNILCCVVMPGRSAPCSSAVCLTEAWAALKTVNRNASLLHIRKALSVAVTAEERIEAYRTECLVRKELGHTQDEIVKAFRNMVSLMGKDVINRLQPQDVGVTKGLNEMGLLK